MESPSPNRAAMTQNRRMFLRACLALPAALALNACGSQVSGQAASPTAPLASPTSAPVLAQPPTPSVEVGGVASPTVAATVQAANVAPASTPALTPTSAPAVASPTSAAPGASPVPPAAASATPQAAVQSTLPTCTGTRTPTASETEGPYFKAGSPLRASLVEPGMAGTRLSLTRYVLNPACGPVANAKLDFWQANAEGQYDNSGYTLRGHQMTDAVGHYALETVVPGLYPGRTGHIHVKVQPPGGPLVTTQLYFPGVSRNSSDPLYQASLQMTVADVASGKQATFNFVVATA